jgi:hypothetical protein
MKCRSCFVWIFVYAVLFAFAPRCSAATAVGHVVDPHGAPVVGATVYVADLPRGEDYVPAAKTDKSGDFTVQGNTKNGTVACFCVIDAKGLAPWRCTHWDRFAGISVSFYSVGRGFLADRKFACSEPGAEAGADNWPH